MDSTPADPAEQALDAELTEILNAAYIAGQHLAGKPVDALHLMPPDLLASALGGVRTAYKGYQVQRTIGDMTTTRRPR